MVFDVAVVGGGLSGMTAVIGVWGARFLAGATFDGM
jgi:cation diffusion facilitator CzcD-associated flavoprotein CzcO